MFKTLLEKQFMEVFRSYLYDYKKNQSRSRGSIISKFVLFGFLMVVILGGSFTAISLALCSGLVSAGAGWLYFLIMSGIAIVLGAFGSIFNTYVGLYLSKDNDLLLSMPVPLRTIIASRLAGVYLLGVLYSAVVIIPAVIVFWCKGGLASGRVLTVIVCDIILSLILTIIIMILSCLLGWVVARLSQKVKHKNITTVVATLLFIALYYIGYFKAANAVSDLILNAAVYSQRIKGASYALYLFGSIGEGNFLVAVIALIITLAILFLVYLLLKKSFLSIATESGMADNTVYVEKKVRERSVLGALFAKEMKRFTSNANYMLNCGLGIILIPASAIVLLIKGPVIVEVMREVFPARPGCEAVVIIAILMLLASMIDIAAPSVSLEGKSIWIPQSLPVDPGQVLKAKMLVQLVLSAVPMFIAAVCGALVCDQTVIDSILIIVFLLVVTVFNAIMSVIIGVRMPVLNWTNEITPIKQSGAAAVAIFGGWAVAIVFGLIYFLIGYKLGLTLFLAAALVIFAAVSLWAYRRLLTRGAERFAEL